MIVEEIVFKVENDFRFEKTNKFLYLGLYMNGSFPTNLHTLWDQGLIVTRLQRNFTSNNSLYYDHIYEIMNNQTVIDDDDDNNIDQWIKENINYVCSIIYFDESNAKMNASMNFTLREVYYQKSIEIIEQRLAQGGRRLGVLLNQIFQNRSNKTSNGNNKLCFSTIILIVLLSLEAVLSTVTGTI